MSRRNPGEPRAATARRDRLVYWACGWVALLPAVPFVVAGWTTDGGTGAGDAALRALSPPSLLGVVCFGVVLAVALARPGLGPSVGAPPHERSGGLRRLRWAAGATGAGAAGFAAAVLLADAARSGAAALGASLDDGSALWAWSSLTLQVLLLDLRAPVSVVVALVVLARAQQPVSARRPGPPRSAHGGTGTGTETGPGTWPVTSQRAWPVTWAGRTRRPSRGRPPG